MDNVVTSAKTDMFRMRVNPNVRQELTRKILDAGSLLKENPYMGAALSGKVDYETDLRFLVVSRQLVFYCVCDEEIEITRVLDRR